MPRQTLIFLSTGSACWNAFPIWAIGPSICSDCSSLWHAISCGYGIGVLSLIEAGISTCLRNAPGCGVPMKICGDSARTQRHLLLHGQIIQFRMSFQQVQGFHLLTQVIVKPMRCQNDLHIAAPSYLLHHKTPNALAYKEYRPMRSALSSSSPVGRPVRSIS